MRNVGALVWIADTFGVLRVGAPPYSLGSHHVAHPLVWVVPEVLQDAQWHGLVLSHPESHVRESRNHVPPGSVRCVVVSSTLVFGRVSARPQTRELIRRFDHECIITRM
jgi:hypothetical protein